MWEWGEPMPSRLPSIALVALILIAAIGCEAQPQWVHITLASSEHRIGEYSIDGDWIAWVEKERFGRSPDIFLFDGKTVRQLSSDNQSNTRREEHAATRLRRLRRLAGPIGIPRR